MGQKSQTILAIDYSSSNTGYAVAKGNKLVKYGNIKARALKQYKGYPFGTLRKLEALAVRIKLLIEEIKPDLIIIEEINRSKARMSQKTLDAGHYLLIQQIPEYEDKVIYIDSDGKTGWRSILGLKFTDEDKKHNKKATKKSKLKKITRKHLAQRWVNKHHAKDFDLDTDKTHEDIVDAIGIVSAYLKLMEE